MIKKINRLYEIGKFKDFVWLEDTPLFNKINIIFGYNGSGKTFLSKVFSLYSNKGMDEENSLFQELSNSEKAEIEVTVENKSIKYSKDCEKFSIYTFNSHFIAEHVFDGTVSNCKEFDGSIVTEDQLKNPRISMIEDEIIKNHIPKLEKEDVKNKLDKAFDVIKTNLSTELNSKISGKRLTGIQIPENPSTKTVAEVRGKLDKAYEDYSLSQKQEELQSDLTVLQVLNLAKLELNTSEIISILSKNISQESNGGVRKRIKELSDFQPQQIALHDWFEMGSGLLVHKKNKNQSNCPLCNTNINASINSLINEYQDYFNDEYSSLTKDINAKVQAVTNICNVIDQNRSLFVTFLSVAGKYSSADINGIDPKCETRIKELSATAKEALINKKNNLATSIHEDGVLNGLQVFIEKYNTYIVPVLEKKDELINLLKGKFLDPEEIIENIKNLCKDLSHAEFDNCDSGNQVTNYKRLVNEIRELGAKVDALDIKRKSEIAKLKNEAKYVNIYLKKMHLYHFEIDIQKNKTEENIHIHFDNGITKTKIRHSLSESEKTTLAFSYFLSKIHYEVFDNPAGDLSTTTVVIDDPISSLDEDRMHTTAFLIKDIFRNAHQLFIFSHNLVFLRFLSNIIGNTKIIKSDGSKEACREDYFLRHNDSLLLKLPESLQNYQTLYFQKFNEVIKYSQGDLGYEEAKHFIPNYIRIVLETFLAFKLHILKDGSSDQKFIPAGLNRSIKFLNSQLGLFRNYSPVGNIKMDSLIEKLEDIKKVTDPQSHGSVQYIDMVNFINEPKLKEVVKDTLDVIYFLDRLHIDRIAR